MEHFAGLLNTGLSHFAVKNFLTNQARYEKSSTIHIKFSLKLNQTKFSNVL